MNKMIKSALLYIGIAIAILGVVALFSVPKAVTIGNITYNTFIKISKIMAGIFLIIGLIKVWVSPKMLSKFMGEEAGWKGLLLVATIPIFLGGSLFTMFPLMKTLREKGASIAAILAFLTAWGGKAPLLPMEIEFLGINFAIMRIVLIIPLALTVGILGEFILKKWGSEKLDVS
ncbi:MAG: hypothetical protein U5K53_06485 [Halanaerobiales bacterium]|nr:hypothetical protein [Halanaerobiales bacterium]